MEKCPRRLWGWCAPLACASRDHEHMPIQIRPRHVLQVHSALATAGVVAEPILVPTSAKSRLGRDAVWRLLRCVVLDDDAR